MVAVSKIMSKLEMQYIDQKAEPKPCLLEDLPSYNNKRVNQFQHLAEIINKMDLQSFPDIVGQLFVILAVICGENQLFYFDPAGGNCLFTHPPMGSTLPVQAYSSLFQSRNISPYVFVPLSIACQGKTSRNPKPAPGFSWYS